MGTTYGGLSGIRTQDLSHPKREYTTVIMPPPHPQWKMAIMSSLFDKGMKTWMSPLMKKAMTLRAWLKTKSRAGCAITKAKEIRGSTGQIHCETEGTSSYMSGLGRGPSQMKLGVVEEAPPLPPPIHVRYYTGGSVEVN